MIKPRSRSGSQKRQTVSKGISLRPVDVLALDFLQKRDRRDRSAVVQVLIDEEMKRAVGRGWERLLVEIASRPPAPPTPAAPELLAQRTGPARPNDDDLPGDWAPTPSDDDLIAAGRGHVAEWELAR